MKVGDKVLFLGKGGGVNVKNLSFPLRLGLIIILIFMTTFEVFSLLCCSSSPAVSTRNFASVALMKKARKGGGAGAAQLHKDYHSTPDLKSLPNKRYHILACLSTGTELYAIFYLGKFCIRLSFDSKCCLKF